ncbi:MAG: glutamine amidotransferase [Pseudomonadota bacterium]|nr:glutamine amidotransferase [Pseudomonadota bacterium]
MTDRWMLVFEPLVPQVLLWTLAGIALLLVAWGLRARARGSLLRLALMAGLLFVLAGPTLQEEERRYHPDTAVVVVDRSASQSIGDRTAQTDRALAALLADMEQAPDLDIRVVETGGEGGLQDSTALFAAMNDGLDGIPRERLAGVIVLTDGQAHDLPDTVRPDALPAPLHVLVTGSATEQDRRIEILSAPTFAIVDQQATARLIVRDTRPSGLVRLEIRRDGEPLETRLVEAGREVEIGLPVSHGGANLFELSVAGEPDELTLENNRAALTVNGVRDRLKVLLVSGEPYPGERAWRNLLKADPAVDLVHFTILRPPEKQDATPIHELALIAFPIRELFELKLHDFDLIIFDRFWRRGVLHYTYLENIARYVREGGALLDAAGPSFAGPASLFRTPLGDVLPSVPTGDVTTVGFRPELTDTGRRHPVTAGLEPTGAQQPWGRWFRVVDAIPRDAAVLLSGPGEKPLLVLGHVGKGRVAQVLSDHGWLWSRGFEGGGPQAEMMRRTAHWLMKEPALEEERLDVEVEGRNLLVRRHSLTAGGPAVAIRGPLGGTDTLELEDGRDGVAFGRIAVDSPGLYRLDDGTRRTVAVVGNLNPVEFGEPLSTEARLRPFAEATGGGILRLERHAEPSVRRIEGDRRAHGSDWLGLVENRSFDVTGLRRTPLAPPELLLLLLLGLAMTAWWRESR